MATTEKPDEGLVYPQGNIKSKNFKHCIRLLSWNIDGLDQRHRIIRTKAVCDIIKEKKPHIVFLQEVVEETENVIKKKCGQYMYFSGFMKDDMNYYTCVLIKRNSMSKLQLAQILPFIGSQMGRNLIIIPVNIKGISLTLMNVHLESLSHHYIERQQQLSTVLDKITNIDDNRTILFGGDTNIRECENQQLNLPSNIHDVWDVTGRNNNIKYTYNMSINDNHGSQDYQDRYDRLYIKHSSPHTLLPVHLELIGTNRINTCRMFPSDHFGILAYLQKL